MGAFDDLMEQAPADSGSFGDLVPTTAKKKVGAGEVAARAGSSFVSGANAYAAMPLVGAARLLDIGNRLLGLRKEQPSYTDILGEHVVEPNLRRIERAAPQPNEDIGTAGRVALEVAPEFGKMVPDIAEGMGLATAAPKAAVRAGAPVIEQVLNNLRHAGTAGVPAGERRAVERSEELRAAGVDPVSAAAQGATSGAMTVGQFALPASAGSAAATLPARVASRAGQGALLNVASGASTRAVENAMLPEQAGELRQPVASPQSAALDAIVGAIFGQMGGRERPAMPTRESLGYQKGPALDLSTLDEALVPMEPPAPRPAPATEYDPRAAVKAVTEALFRTPEGAPAAPDMQLIPKGAEAPAGVPPAPDVSEVPLRVPPEMALEGGGYTGDERVAKLEERAARQAGRTVEQPAVVAVNSRGEAIPADENLHPTDMGTVAGKMQNELARQASDQAQARRAFDVAESQRERKQAAQDVGGRDLREARAGGSTSAEGTAATAPETFNFLDVQRGKGGAVASTGPEVEIHGETTIKQGEKEVPAYKVSYTRELPDGTKERVFEDVAQSRVSQLARPKGPRFAQDIAATSYAPPRGVGTGEQQPKPREAAQRITTEPSPEFIPAERAAQRGEATRAGRDVSDQAFERIANKGGDHAGDVSGDQRQIGEGRAGGQPHVQPGAERGGGDLQQPQPGRADGTGQGAGGERQHRGETQGAPGEAQAAAAEADSLTAFEHERDQGFKQNVAQDMRSLAKSAGWHERGGRLIRRQRSEVAGDEEISRTKWLGHEWHVAMRQELGRMGLGERGQIMLAVEKWLEGEALNANERRTVDFMLKQVMEVRDQAEFTGLKIEDAQAADVGLSTEGVERTPQNLYDVDYLSRVDPDVLERLAIQHGDDTEAFMQAVAKEVNGEGGTTAKNEPARADTGGGGDEKPAAGASGDDAGAGGGSPHEGEPRVAQHPGGDAGESRPALALEHPTEQQLRARDAERRRVAEEQARKDKAPPPEEFTLAGSDRAADQAAAHGQKALFDAATAFAPKDSNGGTLYGNPFANPTVISQALKWAFGDAEVWVKKGRELAKDIADLRGGRAGDQRNVVRRVVSYLFDSAAGDMRAAIRTTGNSATAQWVMNQLHNLAGSGDKATGETFHDAVRARVNQALVQLHKLLGDELLHDDAALKQIAALVRNPSGIKPGTPIHDAADGVRKMLDETLKYMKAAGVDVGEVKGGYYPREYDVNAVLRDPKGFIEAVARAYRDGGMTPEAAALGARELHDGILYGETNTIFKAERGATRAPFVKGRVFGKEVDQASHPLNKFLISDPALSLAKYFERAAKRAETARRFGDNFEKWGDLSKKIIDEGSGAILGKLSEYISLDMGLRNASGGGLLRASSVMRTWGALSFLEKATLSSLTEFMVPALRSGNVLDIGRSLKNTLGDLFTKTHGAEERRAFAEDLGLISGHISSSLASARFAGGEAVGRIESKVLDAFFKRTGLNQWTDATRVGAADLGRVFIRRLAKDMEGSGQLSRRYLAELGVPTEQAKDFAKYVLGKNDGMPSAGDLTGSLGDVYRVAVRKFVSQSIMDPTHGSRPKWMSHPIGSVIGQLQAFNYAFYENVLKRSARLAKDAFTAADYTMAERAQMMMPTMMLPLVTAAAFAIGETRDALLGDPNHRNDETFGQKALKAVSRGTPIAPLDALINYASSARYSRSATESFAGPALGNLGRAVDATRDVLLKNSEHSNTQERRALKAAWDILIEPTVNLALYAAPAAPAFKAGAAVATQLAGTGSVREKLLVEPLAGPQKEKKEAGRAAGRAAGRSAGRS